MKVPKKVFALIICVLIGPLAAAGSAAVSHNDLHPPTADNTQILQLKDGSNLNGKITEVRPDEIEFESTIGTMTIAIDRIKEVREVPSRNIRDGIYWFPNPNRTRMFIGPTGRMQPKGTGYFSDTYLFFPSVGYGFTSNFSLGAGMSIFPGLSPDEQLFYFNPKLGLTAADNFYLAANALVTVIPDWAGDDWDEPEVLGMVFGVGTYGTDDASITAGLGWGYVEEDFADQPVVILGGEYRFARRFSLVTENWLFPGVDNPFISYGMRFFGEGISVDFAFLNVASDKAVFPGIPYLGFVWNFGRR